MSLIIDAIKKAQQLRLKELRKKPFLKGMGPEADKGRLRRKIIWVLIIPGGLFFLFLLLWIIFFPPSLTPHLNQSVAFIEKNESQRLPETIISKEHPKEFFTISSIEKSLPQKKDMVEEVKMEEPLVKKDASKKKKRKIETPKKMEMQKKDNLSMTFTDPIQGDKKVPSMETPFESKKEETGVNQTTRKKEKREMNISKEKETQKRETPLIASSDPLPQRASAISPKEEALSRPLSPVITKSLDMEKPVPTDKTITKLASVEQPREKVPSTSSDVLTLFNQGVDFYSRREIVKAIQAYQKAIEKDPAYIEAYNNLGIIYQEIGDFNKALEIYQKAIEINPQYGKTFNNLGILFLLKNRYNEAIEAFRKAITINPTNVESYINLGILFRKQGQTDRAVESYQEALTLDPLNGETHYNIGLLHEQLEHFDLAISHYQRFIQLSSKTYPELAAKVQRHLNYLTGTKMNQSK